MTAKLLKLTCLPGSRYNMNIHESFHSILDGDLTLAGVFIDSLYGL